MSAAFTMENLGKQLRYHPSQRTKKGRALDEKYLTKHLGFVYVVLGSKRNVEDIRIKLN